MTPSQAFVKSLTDQELASVLKDLEVNRISSRMGNECLLQHVINSLQRIKDHSLEDVRNLVTGEALSRYIALTEKAQGASMEAGKPETDSISQKTQNVLMEPLEIQVQQVLVKALGICVPTILDPSTSFTEGLDCDSIYFGEISLKLKSILNVDISADDIACLETVRDLVVAVKREVKKHACQR